jgi:hypothetical protein
MAGCPMPAPGVRGFSGPTKLILLDASMKNIIILIINYSQTDLEFL